MSLHLKLGYNVRNWATFEVKGELTPEQRALLDAAIDDTGSEALELASELEDSGVLVFVGNEHDKEPWLWGNDDTGICANIIDIYEKDQ